MEARTTKDKFDPRVSIGKELRMFRAMKGWTLAEMGQIMGVAQTTVWSMEKKGYLNDFAVEKLQKLVPHGFGFDFLQKSRELQNTATASAKEVKKAGSSEDQADTTEKGENGGSDAGK